MSRRTARSRRFSLAGGAGGGGALPPPIVTSVYPAVGFRLGLIGGVGVPLAISGAQFTAGSTVSIGGSPATNVVVVSPNTITCNAPIITAGDGSLNDVTVSSLAGSSSTLANGYRALTGTFWMKQGLGATLDGSSKVSLLADQSNGGHDVSQITQGVTPQPLPALLAAYRNGKTAVDFTGGCALGSNASSLVASGGPLTLLYCGNGGGLAGTLFTLRRLTIAFRFFIFNKSANNWYVYGDSLGGLIDAPVADALISGDHYSSYHAPDRVGANMSYYNAGTIRALNIDTALTAETGTTGFTIAQSETGGALSPKILELVVVPRAITTAERQAWESYCRTEYALT